MTIRLSYPDIQDRTLMPRLSAILKSGWLTKGPVLERFEGLCARYLGVPYAIAVNSGTAALHASLAALGIGRGDEVIVPDFTFAATANMVEVCGADAVLADIDPLTLNLDPREILRLKTRRTRAVIAVHQFGSPCALSRIRALCRTLKLRLIEDAACALGGRYGNRPLGTLSDIGCFSFHPRKIISTGEGGLIVTRNRTLAEKCRVWRDHGICAAKGERQVILPGYNYRLPELSACLGIEQIQKLDRLLRQRTCLARDYYEAFGNVPGVRLAPEFPRRKGDVCVFQSLILLFDGDRAVPEALAFLAKQGIEATISNTSLHAHPYYRKKYGYRPGDLKYSWHAHTHGIAVPLHTRMKSAHILRVRDAVIRYLSLSTKEPR